MDNSIDIIDDRVIELDTKLTSLDTATTNNINSLKKVDSTTNENLATLDTQVTSLFQSLLSTLSGDNS
jgi:hypothetical protein